MLTPRSCLMQLSDDEIDELQPKAPKTWWQSWWWRLIAISVSILIFCGGLVLRVIFNNSVSCHLLAGSAKLQCMLLCCCCCCVW